MKGFGVQNLPEYRMDYDKIFRNSKLAYALRKEIKKSI